MSRAASASPPEAPPVWVQAASALECPAPESVLSALRQRLGVERVRTDEAPSRALLLQVERHGSHGVSVRLSQAGLTIIERTLDVEVAECAELADTMALVTDSWLPIAAAPPEPDPPALTPPRTAAEPGPAPSGRASSALPLALDFALGSALALDSIVDRSANESPVLLVRAGAELNLSPWHLGVRGLLETPDALDPAGNLSVLRSSLEVVLGADVHRAERWALVASVVTGVDLLVVTEDYSSPPGALFAPSAGAGLRGEWRAFSAVDLTATVEGAVALLRDHFVAGRGDGWHTPRVRARVAIGALWHLQ